MPAAHHHLAQRADCPAPRPVSPKVARWAAERARADQIDTLRLQRPLTDAELAEADRLTQRLYMRVYRQEQARRWGPRS